MFIIIHFNFVSWKLRYKSHTIIFLQLLVNIQPISRYIGVYMSPFICFFFFTKEIFF